MFKDQTISLETAKLAKEKQFPDGVDYKPTNHQ
jgi:hypothetical protein